jgi:tetratricopeptide (TPR) repeat protein
MATFENREAWFDQELKRQLEESGVDFAAVEAVLLRRIRECEDMGILSLLRIDEMPSSEKIEQVERELFSQITQYSEYDEPVDECLKSDVDLSEKEWKRLIVKLYERLQPVVKLPPWEQQLMAPGNEPTAGHWEAVESVLFDRISRCDEQLHESWVRYETKEEPAPASTLESAEELLDEQIGKETIKPFWEQIIRGEEIVPFAHWERIEERLFSAVANQPELAIRKQPFWYLIEHYSSLLRAIGVAGAAAGIVVGAIAGFNAYQQSRQDVPTVVYQLGGRAAESLSMAASLGDRCTMVDGGSATLVNSHGFIEMRNSALVHFDKMSKNEVKYRVDFSSSGGPVTNSRISFCVYPRKKNQTFAVTTPDYSIEVKGTYFHVEADLGGKSLTRVLEGTVKITGGQLGDTVLHTGQYLQFDPSVGSYRIYNGGPVIQRSELERLPAAEELLRYKVVSIRSTLPDAEVHIDGNYCGTTPLALRQPAGRHQVRIVKQGFAPIDTSFFLSGNTAEYVLNCSPEPLHRGKTIVASHASSNDGQKYRTGHLKAKSRHPAPEQVADTTKLSSSGQLYNEARNAERNDNWRKAIALYQQVLAEPAVSPLRREDALFSIAKLQADHGGNAEVAKESFLTYLALFPSGSFAGESWLRLAELEFRKNPEHAIQYYLKFFEMFPRYPRIAELQDRVGVIYLQQKHYEKAIGMFEQALADITNSDGNERRGIAAHLHAALLANGEAVQAESVRVRYLVSEKR